ncbi:MAG: Maf family protein [Microthrixaceae bacterium]
MARQTAGMDLVLASRSRYRAQLLADAGIPVAIDPADVDERALDHLLTDAGAEALALELARRKAAVVAPRHPGALVIAADQVGVLDTPDGPRLLTQQPDPDGAVEQLLALSGTTHRLVNGLVVLDAERGNEVSGTDVQEVTFRTLTEAEARQYVERFRPWDTAGSYRLEDQDAMAPGEGFVTSVVGEDPSGVLGLPLPLLRRLLSRTGRPVGPDR